MLKKILAKVAEHEDPGVPWDWTLGVCANLSELFANSHITVKELNKAFNLMSKWAGHKTVFPVPYSPDSMHGQECGDKSPMRAFNFHETIDDVYTGTYGRSRRDMCRYIAEELWPK